MLGNFIIVNMEKIQSKNNEECIGLNIIQFMPYFPPHKWWLETVWEEIWINWKKSNLWGFLNVITSFNQEEEFEKNEKIIFENQIIWYKKNNIVNLVIPSFEIINNFPMYKIWNKKSRLILKYLKSYLNENQNIRLITHTRFFLPSLFWWLFARSHKLKWIHIEHGSDYVKLSSKIKSKLSVIYDKIFWKWIFKKADSILAISEACKNFINNEFIKREVSIFYRWIEFHDNINISENLKYKFDWKIIVWYVWRLYKWKNVESLIKSYYLFDNELKEKIQIVIVWDWEDFERLKKIDKENKIYFTWWKTFIEALSYQKQFDIHVHPSSPWWWLATTLLQAMQLGCFIIATPNEWASEVIKNNINWFLIKNDSIEEIKNGLENAILNLNKKNDFFEINKKIINEKFTRENNILNLYNLIK